MSDAIKLPPMISDQVKPTEAGCNVGVVASRRGLSGTIYGYEASESTNAYNTAFFKSAYTKGSILGSFLNTGKAGFSFPTSATYQGIPINAPAYTIVETGYFRGMFFYFIQF